MCVTCRVGLLRLSLHTLAALLAGATAAAAAAPLERPLWRRAPAAATGALLAISGEGVSAQGEGPPGNVCLNLLQQHAGASKLPRTSRTSAADGQAGSLLPAAAAAVPLASPGSDSDGVRYATELPTASAASLVGSSDDGGLGRAPAAKNSWDAAKLLEQVASTLPQWIAPPGGFKEGTSSSDSSIAGGSDGGASPASAAGEVGVVSFGDGVDRGGGDGGSSSFDIVQGTDASEQALDHSSGVNSSSEEVRSSTVAVGARWPADAGSLRLLRLPGADRSGGGTGSSQPPPQKRSGADVGGVATLGKPVGGLSWDLLADMEAEADARVRRELSMAEQLRREDARLRQQRQADARALIRFRKKTVELKNQNVNLIKRERRTLDELDRLRRENAELLSVAHARDAAGGVEVPIDPSLVPASVNLVPAAAPVPAPAPVPAATPATMIPADVPAGVSWPPQTGFGDGNHVIDRTGVLESWGTTAVMLCVLSGSVMICYALETQFLYWDLEWQLVGTVLFAADCVLAYHVVTINNSQSLMMAATMIVLPLVYFLGSLWATFQQYDGIDWDNNGEVNWLDRLSALEKTGETLRLFLQTTSSLLPLLVMFFGGFAFLWWLGFLQPVLQNLVVYGYCAICLFSMLGLFVYKIWQSLNTTILQFFEQFKVLEHRAEDIFQNMPDLLAKAFEDWRNPEAAAQPFEDRSLANVHRDPFLLKAQDDGANLANVVNDPFLTANSAEQIREREMLCGFAEILLDKFKDVNDAFAAFDVNKNGVLTRKEFKDATRSLPNFSGDAVAIFRALDIGGRAGRFQDRVTKHAFRKLKDIYEEQAAARKFLQKADEDLQKVLKNTSEDSSIEPFFRAAGEGDPGGVATQLRRALDNARSKAVPKPVLLEAEHALYEVEQVRDLEKAVRKAMDKANMEPLSNSDIAELDKAIQVAQDSGVSGRRLTKAIQARQEVRGKTFAQQPM